MGGGVELVSFGTHKSLKHKRGNLICCRISLILFNHIFSLIMGDRARAYYI
jgi:hypothetical protein